MGSTRGWRPGFEQQTARINVDAEVNRRRPPDRQPAADKPAPKRVNASTREREVEAKAASPTTTTRSMSSTATTEVLSLFDQPDGDAPYT